MYEIAILILSFGAIIFSVGVLVLGFRALRIFEAYVYGLRERQKDKSTADGRYGQVAFAIDKETKPKEVKQLSPEAIAPAIKKPPRPVGGFGTPVGNKDCASQIQQRDKDSPRDEKSPKTNSD